MSTHTKVFSSFSVNNMEKAKEFYGNVLGFEVKENPMGVIELHIEGEHHILVYPKPDHVPATFTILNFPVKNIDKAVAEFIQKGISFEQYEGKIKTDEKGILRSTSSDKGPNIAWFKDPAGNILSLVEQK